MNDFPPKYEMWVEKLYEKVFRSLIELLFPEQWFYHQLDISLQKASKISVHRLNFPISSFTSYNSDAN